MSPGTNARRSSSSGRAGAQAHHQYFGWVFGAPPLSPAPATATFADGDPSVLPGDRGPQRLGITGGCGSGSFCRTRPSHGRGREVSGVARRVGPLGRPELGAGVDANPPAVTSPNPIARTTPARFGVVGVREHSAAPVGRASVNLAFPYTPCVHDHWRGSQLNPSARGGGVKRPEENAFTKKTGRSNVVPRCESRPWSTRPRAGPAD
jgi:hypothetical protein